MIGELIQSARVISGTLQPPNALDDRHGIRRDGSGDRRFGGCYRYGRAQISSRSIHGILRDMDVGSSVIMEVDFGEIALGQFQTCVRAGVSWIES